MLTSMRMGFVAASIAFAHLAAAAGGPLPAGKITRYDAALDAVIAPDAPVEKLAEGFTWAEGPAWIEAGRYLLFTDVPKNIMYRWSQAGGAEVFLEPSGYAGPPIAGVREAGANGLFADGPGFLLLADSGTRAVVRLNLETRKRETLVASYRGKRLNSPNDVIRTRDGIIFFTDPPYGLTGLDASPLKEQKINGVYRLGRNGVAELVDGDLSFPNGIALSPDQRTLYVSNSDKSKPLWMAYTLNERAEVSGKRVFAEAADLVSATTPGSPDGMKVAASGHLFASAPGGILIMTPEGKRLGRIETGDAIANCAFGDDGRTLYLTSHNILARVRLKVGISPPAPAAGAGT